MARRAKAQPKKAAAKKEPQKRGPKELRIDLKKVQELAAKGMTQEAVARICGVSPATWYIRVKEIPEIIEAYNLGKSKNQELLLDKALECVKDKNFTAISFLLKTRHSFEETATQRLIGGGEGTAPIRTQTDVEVKIREMTPEQRKARIKELEAKRDRGRGD